MRRSFFKRKSVMGAALAAGFGIAALAGVAVARLTDDGGEAAPPRPFGEGNLSEVVYRLRPVSPGPVDADVAAATAAALRERLRAMQVGDFRVALGGDRVRIALQDDAKAAAALDQVNALGQLRIYDWESDLIGREKAIAARPGQEPPRRTLEEAAAEWDAAGRRATSLESQQLIRSGAFPDAYGAVRLASEQEPDPACSSCSIARPRYYLFSADDEHELLAGPELSVDDLDASTSVPGGGGSEVIEVPAGTVVVSEQALDAAGKPIAKPESAGWYALVDDPELTGAEIIDPRQGADRFGRPEVTVAFTEDGEDAFHELTRAIAQRGQARAIGPVGAEQASALSGHLAIVLDDRVESRPIINFAESPDGIDGRNGAQITGLGAGEARALVAALDTGPLPSWPVRLSCAGEVC